MFGRWGILNDNMLVYRTCSTSVMVSSKSSAVSPGNPTIVSVEMARSGDLQRGADR